MKKLKIAFPDLICTGEKFEIHKKKKKNQKTKN